MKFVKPLQLISFILFSLFFIMAHAEGENFRMRESQIDARQTTSDDVEAEIEFGRKIAARILGQFPVLKNPALIHYVNLVGNSVAYNSTRSDLNFHFTVLDTDFINAYSPPGGYVFITRGAIDAMQNEAELAAVLAHEVAHVALKHIVKEFKIRATEHSATDSLTQLLGSGSSSARVAFTQAVDNAVNMLLRKGFEQKDELQADKLAIFLLANTGYNPRAFINYLKRIKGHEFKAKDPSFKPTHPATAVRINALQQISNRNGFDKVRLPFGKKRFAKYVKN